MLSFDVFINQFLKIWNFISSAGRIVGNAEKRKNPVYSSRTERLIDNRVRCIDKLEVLYEKKRLSSLSITKIVFWNKGRETIDKNDIASNDKLRIVFSEENDSSGVFEILSCDILSQTSDAVNFQILIEKDKKTVLLNFGYMDHNEGVVLRLIHTGVSLSLKGSIKTVKEIKSIASIMPQQDDSVFLTQKGFRVFSSVVGIASLLLSILLFVLNETVLGVFELVCGLLCICMFLKSFNLFVPVILSKDFYE